MGIALLEPVPSFAVRFSLLGPFLLEGGLLLLLLLHLHHVVLKLLDDSGVLLLKDLLLLDNVLLLLVLCHLFGVHHFHSLHQLVLLATLQLQLFVLALDFRNVLLLLLEGVLLPLGEGPLLLLQKSLSAESALGGFTLGGDGVSAPLEVPS